MEGRPKESEQGYPEEQPAEVVDDVEGRPKESGQGYPEEQPDEVAGDEGADSGRDQQKDTPDEAGRGDDGTATGNPRSAG